MKTLTRLEELLNAATLDEWEMWEMWPDYDQEGFTGRYCIGDRDCPSLVTCGEATEGVAELICEMHNTLPALIECAKALKDCHARLRLLVDADRHKMLDAVVEQRAEKALLALGSQTLSGPND